MMIREQNRNDLGMLIGLLLTDGSVNTSGGHKNIAFTNRSEVLHQIFKEKMQRVFGVSKFQEWRDKRWNNVKTTFLRSAKIFKILHSIVPSFRTKPLSDGTFSPAKIPEFVFNLEEKVIAEILKLMFSADGCVCLGVTWNKTDKRWQIRRMVKFACRHPKIKEQVSSLLKKLGIGNKIKPDGIVIWRKEDILKFKEKIGFVDGVEVTKNSKNWEGFEKNKILNLAIKSFELKKKDLEKFNTKIEVINFLKSLLESS
jgi:hypothetical protein